MNFLRLVSPLNIAMIIDSADTHRSPVFQRARFIEMCLSEVFCAKITGKIIILMLQKPVGF